MTSEEVSMTSAGKDPRSIHLRFATVLTVALLALPLQAQEPSGPPAYLFMVESTVAQEDAGDWAEAVTLLAKSHAQHPGGNMWATYRSLTGGPDEIVRTFFPLNKMADLDGWQSNRKIVTEIMGKDRARIVLSDLDLSNSTSERILSFSTKLSHPKVQFKAHRYVWVLEVQVDEGKMTEYAALASRLAEIQKESQAGTWMAYGNALGGDRSLLYYFYGFDKFGEVDGWPSRLDMASESLGASEAARLLAAVEAVTATTTSLWQLESELSQLDVK